MTTPEDGFDYNPGYANGQYAGPVNRRPHFKGFGFVEFMTEQDEEVLRRELKELKPVIAGHDTIKLLTAADQPWGDADVVTGDLGVHEASQDDQSDTSYDAELTTSYLVKGGMSASDIATAIERSIHWPYDATAVREGLKLNIDLTASADE